MTESEAISLNLCPSPFADAITRMYLTDYSESYLLERFRLSPTEFHRLVSWVCETNLRRAQ